ncbi:transporter associated domain-containing protein [Rufibacter sp. LB8]|uniref:transporter associated domain-containing protein n=1 Tax=Rufibacter sp. LB8 TaxID=2777781 RepID=UPI00178C5E49|nr:transporter associated domain-containing protein [Rufibacter sp. LB8]
MESIPPLGEPSSWGSPLLFTLTESNQSQAYGLLAVAGLLFISIFLLTAAMASFQRFLAPYQDKPLGTKEGAKLQNLLQTPEKVVLAGVFVNSLLHLLLAFCAYRFFTTTILEAFDWQHLLWLASGLALALWLVKTMAVAWGKHQGTDGQPAFFPITQMANTLGAPFVAVFLPLRNMTQRTRTAFGAPTAAEELTNSLDQTANNQPMSPQEKGLLKAIVNFSSITVRQIMRSKVEVVAFQRRLPFPALIKQIQQHGYSRIPVFTDGLDKMDGVLYVKDLLPYLTAPQDFVWQNLIRTPYFVPETKKIDELLREFQERRVHMAIVVNEYGDTTGLLTLEDVIEEIVGEIHDELDDEEDHYYTRIDDHTFLFEGRTSLHDFCKIVDPPAELLKDVRQEVESVAGLMLRLFSRIPHTGEEITLGPYVFKIEAADSKKIKQVRVHETVPHHNNEE